MSSRFIYAFRWQGFEIEMKGKLAALVAERVFPETHQNSLGKGPKMPQRSQQWSVISCGGQPEYPKKIGPFNLSSDPNRSTRHDLTAMQFGKEFRAALDNEMEVQGRSAKNLKKGQKLYALVTRIPQ